jgi:hypothetical protein
VGVIESMRSHQYRGARADNTLARFAFDSSDGNMRDPLLYGPSQQGLPLGRVVMIYLFIKNAECLLETRRSIRFVPYHLTNKITYNCLHQCSHHSRHVDMMLYRFVAISGCRFEKATLGAPGNFCEPKAREEPTCDNKLYSRNGIRPRDVDGQMFIHSAAHGMKAVRSMAEDAMEHAS